jgi:site-specific recombinase XerD
MPRTKQRIEAPKVAHLATFLRARRAAGRANSTLANYSLAICHLGRWLDDQGMTVDTVTREGMIEYVCDLREQYGGESLNVRLINVRTFFRWLLAMNLRQDDPTIEVCCPVHAEPKPVYALTLDEVRKIVAVAQGLRGKRFGIYRAAFLVLFLLETGVRLGEALGLTLGDVNLLENRITVTARKTRGCRIIPITTVLRPRLVEYLRRRQDYLQAKHFPEIGHVFISESGREWTRNAAERGCRTIGRRAGLDRRFYPHLCRHTWATLSLLSGRAPMNVVLAAGGWRRLETVARYTLVTTEQIAETQAVSSPLMQATKPHFTIPEDQGALDRQGALGALHDVIANANDDKAREVRQ